MKITTQSIINILPFEESFRKELFSGLDNLSPDQKFNVEELIWDAYGALYQIILDKNMGEALLRVEAGEEMPDKEFYNKVREKTNNEIQNQISSTDVAIDLSETREELEKILKQSN